MTVEKFFKIDSYVKIQAFLNYCLFFLLHIIPGIIFIATGLCLQISSFVILFYLSLYNLPQLLMSSVIAGLISYFVFFHLDNPFRGFIEKLSSHKQKQQFNQESKQTQHHHSFLLEIICTLLEHINGIIMRRICIFVFFIVPTLMEMKALLLLSSLVIQGVTTTYSTSFVKGWFVCWVLVLIQTALLLPMHFHICKSSGNITTLSKKWESGIYPFGPITLKLRNHTTLFDIRMHCWIYLYTIALLSTTFLVEMSQMYKAIILAAPFLLATGAFLILSRHQIRRGERGDEDTENDLFLTILRHSLRRTLVDVILMVGDDVVENDKLQLNMLQWIVDYWATTNNNDNDMEDYASSQVSTSNDRTTHDSTQSSGDGSRTGANRFIGQSSSIRGNMDSSRRNQQSSASSSIEQPRSKNRIPFPSFVNVDERARPAVLSYKKAVEEFPPSRNICILLAVSKRCPAMIAVSYLHLSLSTSANYYTIILLPIIILEYMRISEWLNACHRAVKLDRLRDSSPNINGNDALLLPIEMEPMEILLSIDSYSIHNRGSSLQVWANINASVARLEASLIAAKCVQTANVATDVAIDALSLVKFGFDLKQKGLNHGISILAKELLYLHSQRSTSASDDHSSLFGNHGQDQQHCSYVNVAINLVNNSKHLTKNVSDLSNRWLQGKKVQVDTSHESTVERFQDDDIIGEKGYDESQSEPNDGALAQKSDSVLQSHIIDMDYEVDSLKDDNGGFDYNENSEQFDEEISEDDLRHQMKLSNPDSTLIVEDNQEEMSSSQILSNSAQHATLYEEMDNQGNNRLKLVQAGLAVIAGVVVGGVAIAKKNDERNRQEIADNRRSTVTIERLDDE